jgi:hypothetical protein
MASTTTNYGLEKPVYSEKADVAAMNTNMDKIDTALGGLDAGIAIVANGNTHAAISEGQYVYIRGHNSLAEGLYRATANIAANGTLSGSNVTSAVMGTELAALSGSTVKYTDVINNLTSTETSKPLSAAQGKSLSDQIGNLGIISTADNSTGQSVSNATWTTIKTLELPAGTYIVTGDLSFDNNSTGIRILIIDTIESESNAFDNSVLASGRADLNKTRIISLPMTTTLYLRAYQTTGSPLYTKGRIRAVKLKV